MLRISTALLSPIQRPSSASYMLSSSSLPSGQQSCGLYRKEVLHKQANLLSHKPYLNRAPDGSLSHRAFPYRGPFLYRLVSYCNSLPPIYHADFVMSTVFCYVNFEWLFCAWRFERFHGSENPNIYITLDGAHPFSPARARPRGSGSAAGSGFRFLKICSWSTHSRKENLFCRRKVIYSF